jgi:competence protein ComEA
VSDIDRPRLALYVALGIVVCFLGARYLSAQVTRGDFPDRSPIATTSREPAHGESPSPVASVRIGRAGGGRMTVHVADAVHRPGVYRLAPGARVDDALRRAGGPRPGADLTAISLAAKLEDGRQVLVPVHGGVPPGAPAPAVASAPSGAAASGGTPAPAGATAPAQPVNLNTATLEQLDTLDGVGPGIAKRILDYRWQHGGFRGVEELGEVPGIGAKRLAALTPLVTV